MATHHGPPVPPNASHADKGPAVIAITTVYTVIVCVAVALRFLARHIAKAGFWWDDWFALAALAIVIGSNCTRFAFVHFGLGKHWYDVPRSDLVPLLQVTYSDMLIYSAAVALIKMSAIFFYARIFPSRGMKTSLWIIGGIVIAWLIAVEMAFAFQCTPVRRFWHTDDSGTCINLMYLLIAQSIPNILTDFALLALPVKHVYRLQLKIHKKIAVIVIFFLGNFVAFVAVIRLVLILVSSRPTKGHDDNSWNLTDPNILSSTEISVGVLCICLPAMNVFLRALLKKLSIHTSSWKNSGTHSRSRSPGLPRAFSPRVKQDSLWSSRGEDIENVAFDKYQSPPGKAADDIEMLIQSVERHGGPPPAHFQR